MGYLAPCPACGLRGPCDDGHRLCLVCEGRACRLHGRLDMRGRCRQCDNLSDDDGHSVLGYCIHGVDLDRAFCPKGCRV